MDTGNLNSVVATAGGGFLGGLLLGYVLKKVVKLIAIIVGLFLVGLAYLQYQQLASINWDKIEGSMMGLTSSIANFKQELFHNADDGKLWYSFNQLTALRLYSQILERLMRGGK
jgi:uncharacterized membrane protein (Fun14 family)